MRAYTKPVMQVERFVINEAVAESGCQHYDAQDPTQVTVYCVIGSQSETVFTSSACSGGSSSQHIIDNYTDGNDYVVWYTYSGDGSSLKPSDSVTAKLAELVSYVGGKPGSGWHYATVNAKGTDAFDTNHIS